MNQPTPQNARQVSQIGYAQAQAEDNELEAIETDLGILETEVISGDREAVGLAFRLLGTADGHYAELLAQMLGRLIRNRPRLFLQELKRAWPVSRLDSLVGDLGSAFVDREEAQRYELSARASALRQVSDKTLRKVRDACIAELTKQMIPVGQSRRPAQ